jgi:hypothetical protein
MKQNLCFRRIYKCALFIAGTLSGCLYLQAGPDEVMTVKIQIDAKSVIGHISPDFMGLGYESSAVAQSNFFSAKNIVMVQLYRNLSPHGLIRIGGNVSDHTQYVPDGPPAVNSEKAVTIINQTNLVDLAGFASATGWKVMWGLNLGTGSEEEAVQEAQAVEATLGNSLQSFQIGNEVDIHNRYDVKYDDYESYHSNYLKFKAAVRASLPNAVFSGPDVAGNINWLRSFADTEASDLKLLTHHYYRTGAKTPEATIETLLTHDQAWDERLHQLQQISQAKDVPFRINEVNSFYGGGKTGVSDTFASALWCLDYMFILATYGCNGVNMETDINQLGWISHYSPIVHDPAGNCSVRPEYYGMLAFALAGHGDLLKLSLEKNDLNLSAYATRDEQRIIWLTVINKERAQDANLEVKIPTGYGRVEAFRLQAPSVDSKERVTLAGAEVSVDGNLSPRLPEVVTIKNGAVRLIVPQASAVLLQLSESP